jgi:hypothetical protein
MVDLVCSQCGNDGSFIGIQYNYDHPERYDGISEWRCVQCDTRFGRWSHRILKDGEYEYRWGDKG